MAKSSAFKSSIGSKGKNSRKAHLRTKKVGLNNLGDKSNNDIKNTPNNADKHLSGLRSGDHDGYFGSDVSRYSEGDRSNFSSGDRSGYSPSHRSGGDEQSLFGNIFTFLSRSQKHDTPT
ncbi:hypothetical protein [Paenibacillus tyrfis]|uniref:hypothetical protein n=1 Tax=Paenibacillus tyrfis TaxID=1501230 RepID=UPI00209DC884|nr:hypothetical protein [Paenibacillus tyrfis]MCP1306707.1 hypothetical protein [Paenibacillus tyrfis]